MKYITKPVIIEAEQFFVLDDDNYHDYERPITHNPFNAVEEDSKSSTGYSIMTKQRRVEVFPCDYIIKLADGETYPCNPEVFHNKYKPYEPTE